MDFCQRLKLMRKKNKKSQAEIAKYLKIDQSYYAKYENGRHLIPIDKFIELALIYNVSLDYLAGLIEDPKQLNDR